MRTLLQRQRSGMRGVLLALACIVGLTSPALAQDPRGAVQGRVVDSSGGALPGTTVTVTNTATGTVNTAVTDEQGRYSIPFISVGSYNIGVELTGFKRVEQKNVEVRIGDRLELDFTLEVGGLEETITVAGGAPLLETRSASQGQVIDEKRIQLMPLSDGNPFTLTRLAAGTVYTGDLKFSRPFDNGGTSAITTNGAAGGNEFTLDGSPNMGHGRRVAPDRGGGPHGDRAGGRASDRPAAGRSDVRPRRRHHRGRPARVPGRRADPLRRDQPGHHADVPVVLSEGVGVRE